MGAAPGIANLMQAAVIREHGGYDKVRVESFARPSVEAPDDVVVRVRAGALNRLDIFARKGLGGPGIRTVSLPHISGVDVAGEVAEVGSGVRWGEARRPRGPVPRVVLWALQVVCAR